MSVGGIAPDNCGSNLGLSWSPVPWQLLGLPPPLLAIVGVAYLAPISIVFLEIKFSGCVEISLRGTAFWPSMR